MPAYHRPRTRRSAQAPVGRLPLGTPSLDKHITETKTTRSNHSHSDNDSPKSTNFKTTASHTMSDVENHESAAARAEAKLRRQQERIQQADPMNKPVEKARPSRKQAWKPLDLSDLMPPPPIPNVDEVRVNRYPAQSRDTSLSRSMSSLSQQTAATGGVEMDRNDSATMYDNAGFQMYTGRRRTRQAMTEQSSIAEPPIQDKPKTVEAEYDQDEILKVFKKQLPGLDYLTTNAGMADGEVHFVQHPNGDVSARIWSAKDYEWCPIGHFSNIRKKVEGQLAGDRLKGETAYQKLQQNTLAYFRILAKQREALAMGKPFGQNEIKQALPEPQQPVFLNPFAKNEDPFNVSQASSAIKATAKPYEPLGTFNTISVGPQCDPATPTSHSRRENTMLPEVRSAMLDQLHLLGDRASKRSMSNINLANLSRTVMNDPYQQTDTSEFEEEHASPPLSMPTHYSRPRPTTNSSFPVAISHAVDIKAPTATRRGIFSAEFEKMCAGWQDSQPRLEQTERKTSVLTNGSVPDVGYEKQTPTTYNTEPIGSGKPTNKSHDVELNDWWTSGQKFARQEDFYRHIISTAPPKPNTAATLSTPQKTSLGQKTSFGTPVTQPRALGGPMMNRGNATAQKSDAIPEAEKVDVTRLLIPVYENLASYTQGPNRRDYWCRWSQPPEWCIDRSTKGNESFFDSVWGQPPARVGRDPRYRNMPGELRFGGFSPGYTQQSSAAVGSPGAVKGTTGSFSSVGMGMGVGSLGRLGYGSSRF